MVLFKPAMCGLARKRPRMVIVFIILQNS